MTKVGVIRTSPAGHRSEDRERARVRRIGVVLAAAAAMMVGTAAFGQSSAGKLERGRALVNGIAACGNCHTPIDATGKPLTDRLLSGGRMFKDASLTAYSANLTPDPETGIGRWTDAELVRGIREGIRPDGSLIRAPMPVELYRKLADDDLEAIIAYLRSLPSIKNAVAKSEYRIPMPTSYGPPVGRVEAPPRTDLVRYGEYLAGPLGHCVECHTPRIDRLHHDFANRMGAGGVIFEGPWGASVSRNLTSHQTGLKDWSDDEIARAIRDGVSRDGSKLRPPMGFAYYKNVDDEQMRALIAYMRALKPVPFGAQ